MELNNYLTVGQVQEHFGVTTRGVYVMARLYKWRSEKVRGTRFYLREDVLLVPLKNRRGRKPKKQGE